MNGAAVLILFRRRVVLEDAAALVRAMLDDGRFLPVIVCPMPSLAAELQDAANAELKFVDYSGAEVRPAGAAPRGEPPERQGPASWLRRSYLLRALVALARLVRARARMAALFRGAPAAVVVFEDRAPHPEMVFLAHARRRGVRSVLVSFAAS
ncbi:MAG: hypothetical protein AAB295_00095, partial [Chloroflexota bacterium]